MAYTRLLSACETYNAMMRVVNDEIVFQVGVAADKLEVRKTLESPTKAMLGVDL